MSEPVTIVEIDRDVCSLEFGVLPCTATGTHCYNTWHTCTARPAFAVTTQTIRFAKPRADLALEWDLIPSVMSATASPTELNVGDVDASSGPLGKRAQATVTFSDHPTSDAALDPYVDIRAGNPFERGTFWTKLKARWPVQTGRALRIIDGQISSTWQDGDAGSYLTMQNGFALTQQNQSPILVGSGYAPPVLSESTTREYLIDRIDGPDSSGKVTIRAVDPLRLLDGKTSQAPLVSRGELAEEAESNAATLSVSRALLEDYPETGTLRIASEIITYTSREMAGNVIVFGGLARASDGTTAASHNAGARVQSCIRIVNRNAWQVAKDLIEAYAPSAYPYIDLAQWQEEAEQWLDGFIVSAVISEATPVNTLLAELCRDAQFFIWWDERQRKILLKAVRPPVTVPALLTEQGSIMAGSQSLQERPDERISQIWYFYSPRDLSKNITEEANYAKVRIRIDPNAESPREYQEPAVTKIFSRWLRTDALVTSISARLIKRYRDTPFYLTLSVDIKDGGLWTADVIDVSTRLMTDTEGVAKKTRYQIISAQETAPGSVVKYVLQNYNFDAVYGFWMANDAPDYNDATEEQRLVGGWWARADGKIADDKPGFEYQ
jgi:hypothetical protein